VACRDRTPDDADYIGRLVVSGFSDSQGGAAISHARACAPNSGFKDNLRRFPVFRSVKPIENSAFHFDAGWIVATRHLTCNKASGKQLWL